MRRAFRREMETKILHIADAIPEGIQALAGLHELAAEIKRFNDRQERSEKEWKEREKVEP